MFSREVFMSLQFIIGNSGAGKSYAAYQNVIREASRKPTNMYYVIVPEQFTMQTQKTLVEMHPQKGILNIDVLSFERLAYRIFEEVGGDTRKVLEETGKNMVLLKLVQMNQKKLVYLKNQMKKPGYLDEVKSLLSEFMQYEVHEEEIKRCVCPLSGISGISVRSFYDIRRSSGSSCKRNSVFTETAWQYSHT